MYKLKLLIIIILPFVVNGQQKIPGNSYFNSNGYVEYIFGNLPIIISVPHGGWISPNDIPNRTETVCGLAVTTVRDSYTQEIARALDTAFKNMMGCRPHTIICKINRTKVDMNRPMEEAACGNPVALTSWGNYQAFIDTARRYIKATYQRGLFIDLHGHGHSKQRIELGYTLSAYTLRQNDAFLNQPNSVSNSSIQYLAGNNISNQTHAQLIRSTYAFGTLLNQAGYPSVPSLYDQYPETTDAYFDGGYNTSRWGSSDSSTFDAIQIETNYVGIRNNYTNIKKFADSLALVIKKYLEFNMFNYAVLNTCHTNNNNAQQGNLFNIINHPNIKGTLHIMLPNLEPEVGIYIYQNDGKLCFNNSYKNTSQIKITMPNTANGMYLIKVLTKSNSQVKKIYMCN